MPQDVGNPDAAQDESLIQSVMDRRLGPIFEAIGSRLRDLEEDLGETKDLLYKFTEGLVTAADNHRRTTLSSELSSKYGKDIEPFEGFYKDTMGKGLSESLLEELMGDGAPDDASRDEWIKGKLGEAKGKYGKYVGLQVEESPQEPLEEEAKESPEAQQAEEESGEEVEEEPADDVGKFMKKLKSVGGERRSLSKAL